MGAQSIFVKILIILIGFNVIFYITGWNSSIVSTSAVIGIIVGLAVIGILLSVIPTASEGNFARWLIPTIIVLTTLYQISFDVLTFHISYGIGLATSLSGMFSPISTDLSFMPWLFFTCLGLVGVITGVLAIGGGD